MIGVFVTFRYADSFDEQALRNIAVTARAKDPKNLRDAVAQDVGHGRSRVEPGRRERKPALTLRRGERILLPSPSQHRKREATR